MTLPTALLKRLEQRGLVDRQRAASSTETKVSHKITPCSADKEEVIAEDYDEMEELEHPSVYESKENIKRPEENFWLERMKLRIGEAGSYAGHKGCPNKYNIYHKCTLFCVNRWAEGQVEPSREYIKRYKRLIRRYPLPKGWTEMYDPGCGCFYFWHTADNMVSWLPPTHPKSEITKCAAAYRRQLEEASNVGGSGTTENTDEEGQTDNEDSESRDAKHQRQIDDIIKSTLRSKSPPSGDFQNFQNTAAPIVRKQKSRDLERTLSRQHRRELSEKERDQDRTYVRNHRQGRGCNESEALDPMDPSAYSDTPRGKWSDGLSTADDRKKSSNGKESGKAGTSKSKSEGKAVYSSINDGHNYNNDGDD